MFFYILEKYVSNFFTLLIGFSLLFGIIDFSFNISYLNSFNHQVLYLSYMFLYALFILYPLVFVFAFLLTFNNFIKSNELISFYALGFYPKKILKPILIFMIFFSFFMLFLQSTKLAYIREYALSIKNKELKTKDIFIKHKNLVIYIGKLNPLLKKAYNVRVFYLDKNGLKKVVFAKEAIFKKNIWVSNNAEVIILEKKWITKKEKVSFLKDFKPKVLYNLNLVEDISLKDAFFVIKYLNIDLNAILGIVFFKLLTPISSILLTIVLFYKIPILSRTSNVSYFMIQSILISLIIWGIELLIFKFIKQGIFNYWVMVLPSLILSILLIRSINDRVSKKI